MRQRRHGASTGSIAPPVASAGAPSQPSSTTASTIKIGMDTSVSGVYAPLGESIVNGFKMYLDQVGNTAGGRSIQVSTEDEASDPKVG